MISPDISKVGKEFELNVDKKLQFTEKMFSLEMLNDHFCINARTRDTHTECDSSYTIISVPPQEYTGYKSMNALFDFDINEHETMTIQMIPKVAFMYSGYMLCHYQLLDSIDPKVGTFLNMATYGNKRLFDNI